MLEVYLSILTLFKTSYNVHSPLLLIASAFADFSGPEEKPRNHRPYAFAFVYVWFRMMLPVHNANRTTRVNSLLLLNG